MNNMEVKILGKVIGTCDGWDQGDTWLIIFHGFKPNDLGKKFLMTWCDDCQQLQLDFERGVVEAILKDDSVKELSPSWRIFEVGEGWHI